MGGNNPRNIMQQPKNFRKICGGNNPRLSYSDLNIWNLGADPHLGFYAEFEIERNRTYIPRRSYSDSRLKVWGPSAIFRFDWKVIFKLMRPFETDNAPSCQFSVQSGMRGWTIDDLINFFIGVTLCCDLDFWPCCSTSAECHVFKLFTKCELNRTIRGWVIDDWAICFKGQTSRIFSSERVDQTCDTLVPISFDMGAP